MTVDALDVIEALVLGRVDATSAAQALGMQPGSPAARRLETYRRTHVSALVHGASITFPVTRAVAIAAVGEARWEAIVMTFADAHPPREVRFGAAGLVSFLASDDPVVQGLPPWVAQLADLELWERRVYHAPDGPWRCAEHAGGGTCTPRCLCVTRPLVLRAYRHDVLTVRRALDPVAQEPAPQTMLVAIWRVPDGERRTKPLFPLPERLLRGVDAQGAPALGALLASGEFPHERALNVLRHFLEIGLLHRPATETRQTEA